MLIHADVDGKIRRFRSMKTEWGFDRFLRLQTLNDPSNGYIRDDFCVFGAEVFVIKHSVLTDDVNPYIWKVEKFSTIKDREYYSSKIFVAGGYSWYYALAFVLFKPYCQKKKKVQLIIFFVNSVLQVFIYVSERIWGRQESKFITVFEG